MKKHFDRKVLLKIINSILFTILLIILAMILYDIISYYYYTNSIDKNKRRYNEIEAYHRYITRQVEIYNNIINISDYLKMNNFIHKEINNYDLAFTIVNESLKKDLDPYLVLAIIEVESKFDHNAVSVMGAHGLMQLQENTAKFITKNDEIKVSSSKLKKDPLLNIKLGIAYFNYLLNKFEGNYKYAIIAYNLGINKVYSLMTSNTPLPKSYYNKVISTYKKINKIYNHKETVKE
ncbi:MAG: lytic transglycosylase domain-containing protein [Deferribacterales bacterium]